ncbi:MAG TPA: DUF3520 domain-containing protein, partial [Oligoflexia bacterium]|nr:DUF3520 domain-containing protein [Oligoflexia bacterium]
DVSGSMADSDKLPLLKEAFKTLAAHMRPNDRVAIVTYAGDAGLALDSTPGTRKEEILRAIDRLRAGGSTNGSGGIALAYQTAAKNRITGGVNRVILATDGDFNVGTTSFSGLLQIVEEMRGTGITLTTLGFGQGNYNERNLEQLANKGNGNYFYIDSVEEGREVLGAKLAANMEVAAKDVKVQLEFNPENVKAYRLIGYDNRRLQHQDFSNDAVDAGEVGAGHSVTVLYEVLLADGPADASLEEERRYRDGEARVAESRPAPKHIEELGFLKIRYKRPAEDISTPLEFPLYTSKIVQTIDSASRDFRFAAAVSCFGQVLRQSRYAESCTLADARELAAGALGDDLYGKRKEFVQIVDKAQAVKGARPDGYRY